MDQQKNREYKHRVVVCTLWKSVGMRRKSWICIRAKCCICDQPRKELWNSDAQGEHGCAIDSRFLLFVFSVEWQKAIYKMQFIGGRGGKVPTTSGIVPKTIARVFGNRRYGYVEVYNLFISNLIVIKNEISGTKGWRNWDNLQGW